MSPDQMRRRTLLGTAGLVALAGCFSVTENASDDGSGDSGPATTSDQPTDDSGDTTTTGTPSPQLSTPVAGNPDATVTVAVYGDFACPHCKTFNEDVLPKLRADYVDPGEIRYEHRDFPIPVDETVSWQAPSAARAVQATLGDGAFFEYADLLFATQSSLGPDTYASLAGEVDADDYTVRTAAVERRYDATIRAARQQGIDAGVRGTPTAFVNGQRVDATYDALSSAIDEAQSDST